VNPELQGMVQLQQEVDNLSTGQHDDLSTITKEQLQKQCVTLERQKEFHKKWAERREQETTDNLDKRR
jgi:hypothetical protein